MSDNVPDSPERRVGNKLCPKMFPIMLSKLEKLENTLKLEAVMPYPYGSAGSWKVVQAI